MRITRRGFLKLLGIAAVDVALLGIGGVGYGILMAPNSFNVETVRLKLPRLARSFSGLRLAHISDIHMGGWMDAARFKQVSDLVLAQHPDLLLITGDFLIGHDDANISHPAVRDLIAGLSPLAASIPTFAVLGNHDYWTDAKTVRQMLASSGITDLTNTVFTLKVQQDHLLYAASMTFGKDLLAWTM